MNERGGIEMISNANVTIVAVISRSLNCNGWIFLGKNQ